MSGSFDDESLLAICLLVLRRRRRRRQYLAQRNQEPVVRKNVFPENQEPVVQQDVFPENQEPVARQNVFPENQEPVVRQNVFSENQEPVVPDGSGKSRTNRKWWVHPSLADMSARTHCKMFHNSLREDPEKFNQHYQVSIDCFYDILARIEKSITGTDTFMREAVDPETKLAVTLRYLTTGNTYRVISEEFRLGRSTVNHITRNVCIAIWEILRSPYIGEPSVEEFLKISEDYERKTDFPHCLGSVGGRYIRVRQRSSVNDLFIFHNYCAVALVVLVDSNFYFRYIDVSGYRQESNLLKATSLGDQVLSKSLSLPQPKTVPNFPDPLPYVFVSNELFLGDNVLRPFFQKAPSPQKLIFNRRVEKATAPLDSALALLTSRWRILQRPFEMAVDGMETILKACCVLHNYLGNQEGFPSTEDLVSCPFDPVEPGPISGCGNVRSLFVNYFNSASAKNDP